MPADTRSLLRATKQASVNTIPSNTGDDAGPGGGTYGINDPFASYHSRTGALRCSACEYLPIKHENLWASHAASKSHRSNASRIKAEQEADRKRQIENKEAKEQTQKSQQETFTPSIPNEHGKRKADEHSSLDPSIKRQRKQTQTSDGTEEDPEWERFQREMLEVDTPNQAANAAAPDVSSWYANATVEVEPQLNTSNEDGSRGSNGVVGTSAEVSGTTEIKETEDERRARLDKEAKEEIYARYEEEQRLQDEGEERVAALKARLEHIKQARAARKKN